MLHCSGKTTLTCLEKKTRQFMIVQCSSSLTLEGSVAQIKTASCPALGTEGVTDAAEPRQSDQLAAPMDKGPRRLGKKHTNSGICREGGKWLATI